jgi:ABC-2 type transport system permease protein
MFTSFLFGFALNFDVRNIYTGVLDQDKSLESREFIGLLEKNNYFKIMYYINNQDEIDNLINSDKIMACIVIPHNFSKDILNGNKTEIQALINGTNSNTAGIIAGYVNALESTQYQNTGQSSKRLGKGLWQEAQFYKSVFLDLLVNNVPLFASFLM